MADIVLKGQSYFFPAETVQGAYAALVSLGYSMGDLFVYQPMRGMSVEVCDFVDSNIIYHLRDVNVIYNFTKGYCGVLAIHDSKFTATLFDESILLKVPPEIKNFVPEETKPRPTVELEPVDHFPIEMVSEIIKQSGHKQSHFLRNTLSKSLFQSQDKSDDPYVDLIKSRDMNDLLVKAAKDGIEEYVDHALMYGADDYFDALDAAMTYNHLAIFTKMLHVIGYTQYWFFEPNSFDEGPETSNYNFNNIFDRLFSLYRKDMLDYLKRKYNEMMVDKNVEATILNMLRVIDDNPDRVHNTEGSKYAENWLRQLDADYFPE